jgi:hypothetical protein
MNQALYAHMNNKRKMKKKKIQCLLRTQFLVRRRLLTVWGTGELSGVSFTSSLIPFMRTESTWPNHLPKSLPVDTFPWGWGGGGRLGFNKWIWGAYKHSEHVLALRHKTYRSRLILSITYFWFCQCDTNLFGVLPFISNVPTLSHAF